jgi:hypothetical protein
MRLPVVLASVVLTLFATACSGVPSSSSPQIVRTIPNRVAPSAAATLTPAPNSDPRTIVSDFLLANLGEDAKHTAARGFLTADARNKWTDTTVTIVNSVQIQLPDSKTNSVTVNAAPLGSLDQRGIYTPSLQGDGSSIAAVPFTFGMQKVNGQWRISSLANGLIVQSGQFQSLYQARKIYFLDSAQRRLVPDLRYSALTGQTLCTWLLDQLLNGPLTELQSAVSSDVPAQTAKAQATYDGKSVTIDLPGISQASAQSLERLAAQLAFTFQIEASPAISITDRGKPVKIPGIGGAFTSSRFTSYAASGTPVLYYLHNGSLVDEGGTAVTGAIATSKNLISVALATGTATQGGNSTLLVAATSAAPGRPSEQQLQVGSAAAGLKPVAVVGTLSRPTFAPGTSEVWVASGGGLVRVTADGSVLPVAMAGSAGTAGTIRAIAFSSDGVRLALVIAGADATSEIWVGAVVRSGQDVRVDGLTQITPPALVLGDVAWNNPTTLYTVGHYAGNPSAFGIWSVQSDGSALSLRPTSNLPAAPDTIAAAPDVSPWVSAAQAVWVQRFNSWSPPAGQSETTFGTAPTYLQ